MKSMAAQETDVRAESREWTRHAPKDWQVRQREIEEWARSVGWIN